MAIKSRGEIIFPTDIVQLRAKFKNSEGNPADLDAFPQISIIQPSGNALLGPTSAGISKLATGLYSYDFSVELHVNLGVWSDVWTGTLMGIPVEGEFSFIINSSQQQFVNIDGYLSLGDLPPFNYSQLAIQNIGLLLRTLKARLNSSGKHLTKDQFGNEIFMDCDIFSNEQLISFLADSLTWFNEIPLFTNFTFEDTEILQQFHNAIVQGATIQALAAQMLLEKGREFSINENGLTFQPATLADLMQSEWSTELTAHQAKVTMIKKNMRSSPIAIGSFSSIGTDRSTIISRQRFRREGRIA